jgi:hypothetical protein
MTTRRWIVAVELSGLEFGLITAVATGGPHMPTALHWAGSMAWVCGLQALLALSILKSGIWSVLAYKDPFRRKTDL